MPMIRFSTAASKVLYHRSPPLPHVDTYGRPKTVAKPWTLYIATSHCCAPELAFSPLSIARTFAKQGAHVEILDVDEAGAAKVTQDILTNGGSAAWQTNCNGQPVACCR